MAAAEDNVLMTGPPGAGKTFMSAACGYPSALTRAEAIETTRIWSVAGLPRKTRAHAVPVFRAPHHTASIVFDRGGACPAG